MHFPVLNKIGLLIVPVLVSGLAPAVILSLHVTLTEVSSNESKVKVISSLLSIISPADFPAAIVTLSAIEELKSALESSTLGELTEINSKFKSFLES